MNKFLGICILISALLISCALIVSALCDRYYIVSNNGLAKFDKLTGKTYYLDTDTKTFIELYNK